MCGDQPNDARLDLWNSTITRSFGHGDGKRRLQDLSEVLRQVQTSNGTRHMIFPAQDERVMRVVRKIVRGLCYYHQVRTPVPDAHIFADVLKYSIPQELIDDLEVHHREHDIVEYQYAVPDIPGNHSTWLVTFFNQITFVAIESHTATDAIGEQSTIA